MLRPYEPQDSAVRGPHAGRAGIEEGKFRKALLA